MKCLECDTTLEKKVNFFEKLDIMLQYKLCREIKNLEENFSMFFGYICPNCGACYDETFEREQITLEYFNKKEDK